MPLPNSFSNFLALQENKADLAQFLSEERLANAPHDKEVVVAGGFADDQEVESSCDTTNCIPLGVTHKEADICLVLHAIDINFDTVVSPRDKCKLLMSYFTRVNCDNL